MKLKELVEICYGKNQKNVETNESNIPIFGTGGIIGYSIKPLYDKESVLIGRKGTINMPFYINKPFWTIDTLFYTKINQELIIPKYLYYQLCMKNLSMYSEGAAIPSLTTKTLYELEIKVPQKSIQQHIVNTIGSVDDLIENLKQQITLIETISYTKINNLNCNNNLFLLSEICTFDKGVEIGSSNYEEVKSDKSINYIRVGDLIDSSKIFINKELKHKYSEFDDILIAFDGAPGRIGIGFVGAYSSGIYRALSEKTYKGLIYFELKSEINQKIIKDHSQGTTILHASKSIEHLIYSKCSNEELKSFNIYFENIILLKKKIRHLEEIKSLLLNKYFN